MITSQDRENHNRYESLPPSEKMAVDDSFKEICETFQYYGFCWAKDDRAECLIAAITRFLLESQE